MAPGASYEAGGNGHPARATAAQIPTGNGGSPVPIELLG